MERKRCRSVLKKLKRRLVDARNDAAANQFAVLVPVFSVLFLARLVIPQLSVDKQNGKVGDVEVRDGRGKAARERPGPGHNPVAEVVGMSRASPPTRSQELSSRRSGHVLQVFGVSPVAELVLFRVGFTEDVVSDEVDADNGSSAGDAEADGAEGEVARLETVDKGHPDQVANREHETKAIGGDVHGGEDGRLHEKRISDVPEVEGADERHAIGDAAVQLDILVARTADVKESPENQTGSKLVERFDVKVADARVELTADEPVVQHVARITTKSEQLALAEGAKVAVDCLSKRVEEGGRDEARPVLIEDGEARGTVVEDIGDRSNDDNDKGSKGV